MASFTIEMDEELTTDEAAYIGGALKGLTDRLLDARKLEPHLVSHEPEKTADTDQFGKPVLRDGKPVYTTRDTITDCPDCTRGLTGGNYQGVPVRFCPRLDRPPFPFDLKPTPNDIIACGGSR